MRSPPILAAVAIMLSVAAAWAVKSTLFGDLDSYLERGKQIVIADFVAAHDTHRYEDGIYTAEAEVVKVLTGPTKLGKLQVLTLYPMNRGKRYLLYSLTEPDFQAIPQLSVVARSDAFDLSKLDGKTLKEQVRLIFEMRRFHVQRELEQRREELSLLDQAIGKKWNILAKDVLLRFDTFS